MRDDDLLILRGEEVAALLAGREMELIETVRLAYEAHANGHSSLPHSLFLRFPDDQRSRIIALPAYLGGQSRVAGVKWVSSFPANLELGLDRASAVVILNSATTGRPEAIIEGSIISAKRTAASAALAARTLGGESETCAGLTCAGLTCAGLTCAGLIGCGVINFEIARFLLAACPAIKSFLVFDLDPARATLFEKQCRRSFAGIGVEIAKDINTILGRSSLVAFATTATEPHIPDLTACLQGSVLLHISLRDLAPEAILAADNIVDDVEHVCRAQTSVHLAEQLAGNRDFIRCTLAGILSGKASRRRDAASVAVFSPFGLGVLDLAVGKLVVESARKQGMGTVIKSFLPDPYNSSSYSI